jgi:hypothetical protein
MKYNFNSNTITDADAIEVVRNYLKADNSLPLEYRIFVIWKCRQFRIVKLV